VRWPGADPIGPVGASDRSRAVSLEGDNTPTRHAATRRPQRKSAGWLPLQNGTEGLRTWSGPAVGG